MESKPKLVLSRENSWGEINLQTTHKPGLTDIRPGSQIPIARHYHSPRETIPNMMLKAYTSEFFEPPSLPALKAKLAAAKQQAKEQRYIHAKRTFRTTHHHHYTPIRDVHANSSHHMSAKTKGKHKVQRKFSNIQSFYADGFVTAKFKLSYLLTLLRIESAIFQNNHRKCTNMTDDIWMQSIYRLERLRQFIKIDKRPTRKDIEKEQSQKDEFSLSADSGVYSMKMRTSLQSDDDSVTLDLDVSFNKFEDSTELNSNYSNDETNSERRRSSFSECLKLRPTRAVLRFSLTLKNESPSLINELDINDTQFQIAAVKSDDQILVLKNNSRVEIENYLCSCRSEVTLYDEHALRHEENLTTFEIIPNKLICEDITSNKKRDCCDCKRLQPKFDVTSWLHEQFCSVLEVYMLPCVHTRLKMHIAQSNYQFSGQCCCYHVDTIALLVGNIAEGSVRTRYANAWKRRIHFQLPADKLYLPVVDKRACYRPVNVSRRKQNSVEGLTFAHTTRYHDFLTRWRDAIDSITQCLALLLVRFGKTTGTICHQDLGDCRNRKQSDAAFTDQWLSGGAFGSRSSVLVFRSSALAQSSETEVYSKPGHKLHITFRVVQAETKLLAKLLECHGVNEAASDSNDYNILWTGSHPKPGILRSMAPHQRVNHFPRSYELTRKDRLYKNIEKMQHAKGLKHFDFIPQTFLMPTEYRELCTTHHRVKGPWIVKPAASSRGRGIYIVESPNQVPIEEPVVVAKYISKPLLIRGHKCDLRLYVAVTSFDPLLIYIYEEGMVRFATVKYDTTHKQLWNPCMHLCNYSINKYHSDYVKSDDPSAENVGHKWTLSALLRHLKGIGKDTAALMTQVEDLVIKAILSCGNSIVTACKMFVPNPVNCFELYGFDILIDENLKPWLLEVNLSPSLGCDSPLDVRLKSAMLSDLLTLVGIPAVDPMVKIASPSSTNSSKSLKVKLSNCRRIHSADGLSNHTLPKKASKGSVTMSTSSLTAEDTKMVKIAKSQFLRRGGFVRIFPAVDSWTKYATYLDPISGIPIAGSSTSIPFSFMGQHNNNQILYKSLYPDMVIAPTVPTGRIDKHHHRKRDGSLDGVKRCEGPVSTPRQDRYERKLSQGHRSTLSSPKKPLQEDYSAELKRQVCDMVKNGKKLSQVEARKAFSQYLMCVLRRISTAADQEGHIEIVLKFLQKASTYLKNPFYVKIPSHKLSDKDRAAIVAKQLNDFLYLYNRETELYADLDRPSQIPKHVFNEFLEHSSEGDLEELLILQNIHTVPNQDSNSPSSVTSFQGLLRCLPSINSICFSSPEAAKKPVKVTPLS